MGVIGALIDAFVELITSILHLLYEIVAWPFRLLARGIRALAGYISRLAQWISQGREPSPLGRFIGWVIALLLVFVLVAFSCRAISNTQFYLGARERIEALVQDPSLAVTYSPTKDMAAVDVNAAPSPTEIKSPQSTNIVSTFNGESTDGWILNVGSVLNPAIGGNTGGKDDGHLRFFEDPDSGTSYYVAPTIYHGDWRRFSELRVDLWSSGGDYFASGHGMKGDVFLANGPLEAWRIFSERPPESWKTFVVPLADNGEWVFGAGTMKLDDVLANVTDFRVRAEYGVGEDLSGLDNVALLTDSSSQPMPLLSTPSSDVSSNQPFYFNEFDQPPSGEWSNQAISVSPNGQSFLGEFGNQTVEFKLNNLPPHSSVELSFDLFIIRSWDGNDAGQGPDKWSLNVGGGQALLSTTFNANPTSPSPQAYPDKFPGGNNSPNSGAAEVGTLGYNFRGNPWNSIYELSFSFPHTADSLQLDFSANGLQGLSDESWGIDNVKLDFISLPTTKTTGSPVNIAPEARVEVSSVYDECNSGKNAVDGAMEAFTCTEWASRGEGSGATLRLAFTRPRRIIKIILYDRLNKDDHVLESTLIFSDETAIKTGSLPNDGTPKEIEFEPKTVEWIEFLVNKSAGPNIGLGEIEVHGW